MKLQTKIIVLFIPLALVAGGGMAFLSRKVVRTILNDEVSTRGLLKASDLSAAAVQGFESGDERILLPLLQSSLEKSGAIYAVALDQNGAVLAHTNVGEKGKVYDDANTVKSLKLDKPLLWHASVKGKPVLEVSVPVWKASPDPLSQEFLFSGNKEPESGVRLGTLRLGVSLAEARQVERRISKQVLMVVSGIGGLALAGMLFAVGRVFSPVRLLAAATERVTRGEYGVAVPITSSDEIGELSASFNRMSQELAETTVSKTFFDNILKNMMDALIVTNSDGNIRLVNATALRLLGYDEKEVLNRPLSMLFADKTNMISGDIFEQLARTGFLENIDANFLRKDGGVVPVLLGASLFHDLENQDDGFIVAARDMTFKKHAEQELLRAHNQLEQRVVERTTQLMDMNKQLMGEIAERRRAEQARQESEEQLRQSQKMEAVGRLAGGISHDFNNLLTVIIGYSKILMKKITPSGALYPDMEQIDLSAQRAAALTGQLLAFSRRQVLKPRMLDLNTVVTDMERMLQRLIGEDVEFNTELDPNLGCVRADPRQLEQVILNLAINARDALVEGGVISLSTWNVDLPAPLPVAAATMPPGSYVVLEVADNGVGIPESIMERIFEPFFTTKDLGKGTGLGLSMVYGIIQQSGGYIRVQNRPNRGASFQVYLPRVASPVEPESKTDDAVVNKSGSGTILLVEDEKAVRTLAAGILREAGYEVLEAAHPGEAIRHCENRKAPIDLLLTDIVMPQMNGRELAHRLLLRCPHLKVLYVSGYTGDEILRRGVTEDGAEFLAKPFTPDILVQKVADLLAHKA